MIPAHDSGRTRRDFLKTSGMLVVGVAAASAAGDSLLAQAAA